jgi:glycosyltransferase involved in cell wall biosynthesis
MRIAVFTDNDFNKVNGVTTTLRALLRCAPPELQIRIYTADAEGTDRPEYLSLRAPAADIPFYPGMALHFPAPWAYLRHAIADRIDLVHMTTPGPVGMAALLTAWQRRLPLVGSFHTDLATYAALLSRSRAIGAVVGRFLRWPYGRCDRVFAPSVATGTALEAARIGPGKPLLWFRGVDTDRFSPMRRSEALRRQWGADADTAVVIYLGRVSREKNLEAFLATDAALRRARRPYRLVFVGEGPWRSELARLLPGAIVIGSVPHEEAGAYLASADVFAFPSRTDTAGNVVLEAQAAGLPVVIGDEGGPRENAWIGRSAILVNARDEMAFADGVTHLVGNPQVRRVMSNDARTYALTRDWPTSFAPLFSVYRELLAVRARSAPMALAAAVPGEPS